MGAGLRDLSRAAPTVVLALLVSACAPVMALDHPSSSAPPRLEVGRDTFAFPNLVRAERPGRNDAFANYCIVMSRAAGQFFRFARFASAEPPLSPTEYARLTREVLRIPLWVDGRSEGDRVVIPGYADLHAFSRAQEAAIKAAFGSNILSMLQWRTWRVAIALSPEHQQGVARELIREADAGRPAPLMISNFPDPDLVNHAVLVYAYQTHGDVVEFLAYDPNDPENPRSLYFDAGTRAFWVGPLPYGPPGRMRAFRLYASPLL